MTTESKKKNEYLWVITTVSIVIPLAVSLLLFKPESIKVGGDWVSILPHFIATINATTSVLLILALVFIKKGKMLWHKNTMITCFVLGSIFLVAYIIYHASSESIKYGDINHDGELSESELIEVGVLRGVYIFILLSHILLSLAVVPLVLLSFYHALTQNFTKHKKITKYAYPIWLYVSTTGVLVYWMIRPFY